MGNRSTLVYFQIGVVFFPDLRITEINAAAVLRKHITGHDRILLILDIIFSIAKSNALILSLLLALVFQLDFCHTGINKYMLSVRLDRAAGKAADLIISRLSRSSAKLSTFAV